MAEYLTLKLYHLLNRRSKDALHREAVSGTRINTYKPRQELVRRLAQQTGKSEDWVKAQLHEERRQVLANPGVQIYQDLNY